jgi:hypothetical protein
MKFYSEVLDEFFDSEKECVEAEFDSKKKEAEAEEKRRKEAERRKFEAEKAIAKANLEKKIEALNKEVIEYVKTYENETPWLADLVEAVLEPPSQKEKRPAATPITSNEFEKILEGFLN